jgi:hypothetical protein
MKNLLFDDPLRRRNVGLGPDQNEDLKICRRTVLFNEVKLPFHRLNNYLPNTFAHPNLRPFNDLSGLLAYPTQ